MRRQQENVEERTPEDRLESWKEIAAYLRRDVTTVQRWEKREAMPVHRHLHDRVGSVYAFRGELDQWAHSRKIRPPQSESGSLAPVFRPSRLVRILAVLTVVGAAAIGTALWLKQREYFWENPIAQARFQAVTDFDGIEQAAAVSRDGRFVAFLSDGDGQMDVWVTQVGSGQFRNLTRGGARELVNPSIRTLGFSPNGDLVTYWSRKPDGAISIWSVPTLGGQPKPYLEGVAEYDWSHDGARLAYHTPEAGDPLFVSDGVRSPNGHPIFTAPEGLHSHFPLWAPDKAFLYLVQGALPDKLDIWRIRPAGGRAEQVTSHMARVSHPILLDRRTLMYLSNDSEDAGPWLYSVDVERRIPHRLSSGLDRYTSLAASADGRRLVATLATSKRTLWKLRVSDSPPRASAPVRIAVNSGAAPRAGADYLLWVSTAGARESIRKLSSGTETELWSISGARITGGPAISMDGRVAFSVRREGKSLLYAMESDGTNARVVTDLLELKGSPAWTPDGRALISAANDHGVPSLFRVPLDGKPPVPLMKDYALDPVWSPDGRFVIYSGPDIGTKFSMKAMTQDAAAYPIPELTLTRGARRVTFFPGTRSLLVLRGEIHHKDLWTIDLETGAERQLTNFPADFDIRDFDISRDGQELIVERLQEQSDVVLLDLPRT